MQLNTNLPLAGQQPNVLAAFAGGQEAAQQQLTRQNENALNAYVQQNAGGIMGGDRNALAGMAGLGTQGLNAAMGVQGAQLDQQNVRGAMQDREARLSLAYQQAQQQAQAQAAQMTAAERQAEAAQLERGLAMGTQAQTPQEWDQVMQSLGLSDMVGQFEQRDMIIAGALGIKDALTMNTGPQYQMLSPQEVAAMGLPAGSYQRDAEGKVSQVGGAGVSVTQTVEGNAPVDPFTETLAGAEADQFVTFLEQGAPARRNIARLDQLEGLLSNVETGFGAAARTRLGEFGIPVEGVGDLQAAQALINSMVPEQRQPGSGPMSDADLALFKQSVPRLINQPGGNARIIQTMRQINEYDAELARIAQLAASGEITRAQAREAVNGMANPLENFSDRMGDVSRDPSQPAAQPQQAAPAGIDPALLEFMTPEERALFE